MQNCLRGKSHHPETNVHENEKTFEYAILYDKAHHAVANSMASHAG